MVLCERTFMNDSKNFMKAIKRMGKKEKECVQKKAENLFWR